MKQRQKIEKITETKNWFFEKITKLISLYSDSLRQKGDPSKIRNEKGEVTTHTTEI